MLFSIILLSLIYTAFSSENNTVVPYPFPWYLQCDSSWGEDIMVTKTICNVGCLMSSVAMSIHGSGIMINNQYENKSDCLEEATPHTLNIWLRNNGGYGNLFIYLFMYVNA